jgi:hypothetical protein
MSDAFARRGRQAGAVFVVIFSIAACGSRPQAEAVPCLPCARGAAVTTTWEQATPRTAVDMVAERVMHHLQSADADGLFTLFGPSLRQQLPIERVRDLVSGILTEQGALKRFSMTWNGKPFLSTGNGVNGEVHGRTVLAGPA